VGAHGSLGDAQPPGDLAVGVPGRQQAQQLVLPGGEPGNRMAAPLGVQAGLIQVRAQQYQQRPVLCVPRSASTALTSRVARPAFRP
jgi:hypothetical protein